MDELKHENNQRDATMQVNLLFHVSGDVFAHHQEHLTVFTAFDEPSTASTATDELKLRFNSSMTPAGSNLGEYYQKL
jgi:hypothetical protein